jgi:hypothetical protein
MTRFFVPQVGEEQAEQAYTELARFAERSALPVEQRVESITFTHNGEEWTARVGATLSGSRSRSPRKRGLAPPPPVHLSDAAVVLAIFPGEPYLVVTDAGPGRSRWANPFYAGRPADVVRFTD